MMQRFHRYVPALTCSVFILLAWLGTYRIGRDCANSTYGTYIERTSSVVYVVKEERGMNGWSLGSSTRGCALTARKVFVEGPVAWVKE